MHHTNYSLCASLDPAHQSKVEANPEPKTEQGVDVPYAASQAQRIVNVILYREYSLGIVFIFSQGRKDLYNV
jgi:hypothetical protein